MQIQERTKATKLSDLADEINNAARECDEASANTLATGMLAVGAAIRAGQSLTRVKSKLAHGKFLKWLADSCPNVSGETAQRWMRLSKAARVTDLTNAKSITDAFRMINEVQSGATKTQVQALGTAAVEVYRELAIKFTKRSKSVIDIIADVQPDELPVDRKEEVKLALQPFANECARFGVEATEAYYEAVKNGTKESVLP